MQEENKYVTLSHNFPIKQSDFYLEEGIPRDHVDPSQGGQPETGCPSSGLSDSKKGDSTTPLVNLFQ